MPRRPRASKASRAQGASSAPTPAPSTPAQSAFNTPCSSAFTSAYPSEDEFDGEGSKFIAIRRLTLMDFSPQKAKEVTIQKESKPFRFLDLPPEVRLKIYGHHFADCDPVIDLHHLNYKRVHKQLAILRTSRKVYNEASHFFYSTRTFRVFSTHPGRFLKTKRPLLARLKPHQRESITKLELRLGPGWNEPPRGWVVNAALGLKDCINVHKLTIFVQIDPSASYLDGFRVADGFYEEFAGNLLSGILAEMPRLGQVEFDAYKSVSKGCPIMQKLLNIAIDNRKSIAWGPERGWTDANEIEEVKTMSALALLNGYNALVAAA